MEKLTTLCRQVDYQFFGQFFKRETDLNHAGIHISAYVWSYLMCISHCEQGYWISFPANNKSKMGSVDWLKMSYGQMIFSCSQNLTDEKGINPNWDRYL